MISLEVVATKVLTQRAAKHRCADRYELRQAFIPYRSDDALCVRVQIRRSRRQPDDLDALAGEKLPWGAS
jgi:hypothetical protein